MKSSKNRRRTRSAKAKAPTSTNGSRGGKDPAMQGEGDRVGARAYASHVENFVAEGRVEPAARAAAATIDDDGNARPQSNDREKDKEKDNQEHVDDQPSLTTRAKEFVQRYLNRD
jgi:hypothetical protein